MVFYGRVPFIYCLVLALLMGCTQLQPIKSPSHLSTEEQLQQSPGVREISSEQLPPLITGQVIYVPIYSEIYNFDQNQVSQLVATLSLRNTDINHSIIIETVDYYDSGGKKVKAYLRQPIQLAPLASTTVVVPRDDRTGGSGANFIIQWRSDQQVSQPIFEAIMINTFSQQGMSFVSSGRVIKERKN
ncbi:hypothetical protein cce_3726 [Crocosphaera subtropica ATCC 51142]|uniref:DUF3124 domain-containing protein n=1 Tax=Crocosphaera subtropica (strain ATCC 51142 / BH68) TaxID=43989 RepID=B1X1P4_CROS5|nr:DUF3124 domain-containing protein [Crocosphaera subtropica]ACB53074.1 hypothetical protein cce_3726 [Crocosphaera subtropica ATCC 51142]